jgi:sodium-coupled neutral amino acid transporter 11
VSRLQTAIFLAANLEFELDSDQLDEQDDTNLSTPPGHMDQTMPLLVGLFESSASRRSIDAVHPHELQGEGDYDLEEIAAKRMAGGSIIDSIANMANSILGAGKHSVTSFSLPLHVSFVSGIIGNFLSFLFKFRCLTITQGLPYAISQAGFVAGLILLVVLCCVTDWTIRLIVINAKLSGRHSYIEIMDHCFGSSGRAAVSFFQFAFAFGGEFSA